MPLQIRCDRDFRPFSSRPRDFTDTHAPSALGSRVGGEGVSFLSLLLLLLLLSRPPTFNASSSPLPLLLSASLSLFPSIKVITTALNDNCAVVGIRKGGVIVRRVKWSFVVVGHVATTALVSTSVKKDIVSVKKDLV